MKNFDLAAARRRQIVAELIEGMRIAQRNARLNPRRCRVIRRPAQIGVWKGGC